MAILYVAFKGSGNSSNRIVRNLSGNTLFLTNSFDGLKRDIDAVADTYDLVYMFGVDKTLRGNVRIERIAQKGDVCLCSKSDLDSIAERLNKNGIAANIGDTPTRSLCNEAYWHMLKKYDCRVVFLHVPSIKYITEDFIESIKAAICFSV